MSPKERQLFGTDGIRGVAGEYPLDCRTVFAIGRALGQRLASAGAPKHVVIGQDTRASSGWIADTIASGLLSTGMQVESAGVLTTPGVAYLARSKGFAAGVVISASHNPWQDNGIKIFSGTGYKLPDALEHQIEANIFSLLRTPAEAPSATFKSLPGNRRLHDEYVKWLSDSVRHADLSGLKVLVDCANGAASAVAPDVFRSVGVHGIFRHDAPDGRNINLDCGALHPEDVARSLASERAQYHLGVTFDGDADRARQDDPHAQPDGRPARPLHRAVAGDE